MSAGKSGVSRLGTASLMLVLACTGRNCAGQLTELQRLQSGTLDVVLLSRQDGLRHGKDTLAIEFRSASDGTLVDVGTVSASAMMPMSGVPMLGSIDVKRADVPGRYTASSDLSMAGSWRATIEWDRPTGPGSVTFAISVQ